MLKPPKPRRKTVSSSIKSVALMLLALAATALAPAAKAHPPYERCDNCGTVRHIEQRAHREPHTGGGTFLGALIGGALGNTVGKGDGRTAATIGGAVVGGAVGHSVEEHHRETHISYWIEVRMDHGRIYSFEQGEGFGLRPGDRVIVQDGFVQPFYR
jgi:outer membrane lipoprotein SlyB